MQRRSLWRLVLFAAVACLTMAALPHAGAQTTGPDAQTRAQLAAIPLTTGDLPDGYTLVGEAFVPAQDGAIAGVTEESLAESGFQGLYTSVYATPGRPGNITSYASAWSDSQGAENGFALIEDEASINPDVGLTDENIDAGTGTAELTTGSIEQDGDTFNISDATFVVDRFVVGVSVTTSADGGLQGDSLASMVETLDSRATSVAEGSAPGGIDLALPGSVLDSRSLGTEIQAGFLSAEESETLYGVSGSSLGGIQTSWITAVAIGERATAPFAVVGASRFENADNAARVVDQSADLVPLSVELQAVDAYSVDGVDGVRGYQYASPGADAPDSFRAVAQRGNTVIVVDVQAADSVQTAQTAVTELLSAQIQCGENDCQAPEINLGS